MIKQKPQIIFIDGGNSFNTKSEFYDYIRNLELDFNPPSKIRWRDALAENVKSEFDYHFIQMPNAMNADYTVWSLWFDKVLPFLRPEPIFIGHSLGGSFLLRYLTLNALSISIAQLHLIAPAIDELDCPGVGNFSTDLKTWVGFRNNIYAVHLWHSADDDVVPINHTERLLLKIPAATIHRFEQYGHFIAESFPELEAIIKNK